MDLNENYTPLFEDAILEELDRRENRRWKIVKYTMKFVDKNEIRKQIPSMKDLSDKEVVKRLREKLDRLPDETKQKLINHQETAELDAKIQGYGKGHKIAGRIVAGAGGTEAAATGAITTGIITANIISGIGASASSAASSAAASSGIIAGTTTGALVGLGGALLAGIAIIAGLAATAILTAATVGISLGVSKKKALDAQRQQSLVMTKDEIIKELQKEEKSKETTLKEDDVLEVFTDVLNEGLFSRNLDVDKCSDISILCREFIERYNFIKNKDLPVNMDVLEKNKNIYDDAVKEKNIDLLRHQLKKINNMVLTATEITGKRYYPKHYNIVGAKGASYSYTAI